MDLPGVAERLGVNHRHIRRLVFERMIPFIKWGHLLRFDPDEIDAWLEGARVPTARRGFPLDALSGIISGVDEAMLRAEVGDLLRRARRSAGMTQRALARAAGTSQAAIARYETGVVVPALGTLARLLEECGSRLTLRLAPTVTGRTGAETAAVRPVVMPSTLDNPRIKKASGVVELPPRVQWSGRKRTYDLSKRADRVRVYEQVLREGTKEDIQRFIRVSDLIELWDDLVLPPHLHEAWERRLARYRKAG